MIFLQKNLFPAACATVSLIFLFIAVPTFINAAGGIDVEAMATPMLLPIRQYTFNTAMELVKNAVYVSVAGQLLQAAVTNVQWLDVRNAMPPNGSAFVATGLTITMALANILLILSFIVLAVGIIFKIDKIDPKKYIPKFLITALLVNFGPLFVSMMADICNIASAGVTIGGPNVFISITKSFTWDMYMSAGVLIGNYIVSFLLGQIPGANIARMIYDILALPYLVFTQVPTYLIQNMLGEILSGLFFSNAVFFISRIFVLQVLTVLSPIAILAGALPQTETWYREWLKWLIGWSTGGILVLFLLTLGLSSVSMLMPQDTSSINPTTYGSYQIILSQKNMYWLFVAIYMMVVDIIAAKVIPDAAGRIESKITSSLGGAKRMAGGVKSGAERAGNTPPAGGGNATTP